jgi:hypothetical protein
MDFKFKFALGFSRVTDDSNTIDESVEEKQPKDLLESDLSSKMKVCMFAVD